MSLASQFAGISHPILVRFADADVEANQEALPQMLQIRHLCRLPDIYLPADICPAPAVADRLVPAGLPE